MGSENVRTWLLAAVATLAILSALYIVRPSPIHAEGPTYVSGIISAPTTWTASGSPYIVTGNILVTRTVTLTVEPGVTVKFDGSYYLRVDGALKAIGTPSQPITFTSNKASPSPGDWQGIRFSQGSMSAVFDGSGNYLDGSSLQYTTIQYGGSGEGSVKAAGDAAPFIAGNTIRSGAGAAISIEAGASRIVNNLVEGHECLWPCPTGYVYVRGPSVLLSNTVRSNKGQTSAIRADNGPTLLAYNTVISNAVDFVIELMGANGRIISNTISGNVGTGILVYCSSVTIEGNAIIGNRVGNLLGGGITVQCPTKSLPPSSAVILRNVIAENQATDGGAVMVGGGTAGDRDSQATLQENGIRGNTASNRGGGIYTFGRVTLVWNDINSNTASRGGGLYIDGTPGSISLNNFAGNTPTALHNALPSPVAAANNYWGTTDTSAIDAAIYDFYDDFDKGIVSYTPILTQPIALPLRETFVPFVTRDRAGGW